ncbi:MAG: ATP-binding protein [Chloroflexota bacterium]
MPTELEFQWLTPAALNLPETPLGWLYIAVWLIVMLAIFMGNRTTLRQTTGRQWGLVILFALLAIFEVIPRAELSGGALLPPDGQAGGAIIYRPLGFISVGLAAWLLNPPLALLIGAIEGLSRALFGSHQLAELFHFAFAGWLASHLIQQKIPNQRWRIVRTPPISFVLVLLIVGWPFVLLATLCLVPAGTDFLPALDLALTTARSQWIPAVLEGLLSGLLAWVAQLVLRWQPQTGLSIAPFEQNSQYRQSLQFLFYSLVLLVLLGTGVSIVGYNSARSLIQTRVANNALRVDDEIPNFIGVRQNLLAQQGSDARLFLGSPAEQQTSLKELFRSGPFFRRLLLVNADGDILAIMPEDAGVELSDAEQQTLERVIRIKNPDQVVSKSLDDHDVVVSLIVPAEPSFEFEEDDAKPLYLIGRIPDQIMNELVRGVSDGESNTYIVNEDRLILAHSNPSSADEIEPEFSDGVVALVPPNGTAGVFYVRPDPANNRRVMEYRTPPGLGHPWTVVVETPMSQVLQQALRLVSQVFFIILAMTTLFALFITYQSSSTGLRLKNFVAAVEQIPQREQGQLIVPKNVFGDDDIGRLGTAFHDMQLKLDQQMGEFNLLLDVSQGVSEIQRDIRVGVGAILAQTVQGIGAAGGQVIITILGRPIIHVERGRVHAEMSLYERKIAPLLANSQDLVLSSPDAIRKALELSDHEELPFQSAIAYPLRGTNQTYYGMMWLAWSTPRTFKESERNLIRSLSEQMTVMIQNWYLYLNVERRRTELGAVLESTVDPVIVTDVNNKVSMMNPAAYAELGITNRRRAMPVQSLIKQQKLVDLLTNLQMEDAPHVGEEIALENGKTFDATVSVIPGQNGRISGRVAVLRDVSEMVELSEMKSDFVRLASHDLKDPITIVNGFIQMLPLTGSLNDKQREQVDRIHTAMEQMQKLVEVLLNITRLESGIDLDKMNTSVPDMLRGVAHSLEPLADSAGNRIVVEDTGPIPMLYVQPTFLRQAVWNLLSNAMKYAPNSGDVTLKAEDMGHEVVISVADGGPGIPTAIQGRLFEKFFRFSQPGQARSKSHGLGLSLVQLVAQRHNGRVWFESTEGEGCTFFLAIPKE